jgi:hypothetical protein
MSLRPEGEMGLRSVLASGLLLTGAVGQPNRAVPPGPRLGFEARVAAQREIVQADAIRGR